MRAKPATDHFAWRGGTGGAWRPTRTVIDRKHRDVYYAATIARPCGPGCPHSRYGWARQCSICLGWVTP